MWQPRHVRLAWRGCQSGSHVSNPLCIECWVGGHPNVVTLNDEGDRKQDPEWRESNRRPASCSLLAIPTPPSRTSDPAPRHVLIHLRTLVLDSPSQDLTAELRLAQLGSLCLRLALLVPSLWGFHVSMPSSLGFVSLARFQCHCRC